MTPREIMARTLEMVALRNGMAPASLKQNSLDLHIRRPRETALWLSVKAFGNTPEVQKFFGLSHSAVSVAIEIMGARRFVYPLVSRETSELWTRVEEMLMDAELRPRGNA